MFYNQIWEAPVVVIAMVLVTRMKTVVPAKCLVCVSIYWCRRPSGAESHREIRPGSSTIRSPQSI